MTQFAISSATSARTVGGQKPPLFLYLELYESVPGDNPERYNSQSREFRLLQCRN